MAAHEDEGSTRRAAPRVRSSEPGSGPALRARAYAHRARRRRRERYAPAVGAAAAASVRIATAGERGAGQLAGALDGGHGELITPLPAASIDRTGQRELHHLRRRGAGPAGLVHDRGQPLQGP